MKKVLIIGAAGFVGNYLIDHIKEEYGSWDLVCTKIPTEAINKDVEIRDLDITNKDQVKELLESVRPDYIFHLAAQSSVALSWKNPQLTVDINIKGTINLLEALCDLDYKPRVLLIGSGEEYGHVLEDEIPIKEDNNTRPGNIYAVTKVTQNMLGKVFSDAYDLDIMSTRSFNHTGPNQAPLFVVADFCKQVADIEKGEQEAVIKTGNLSAKRDFTDVRDVVRAYTLLMEKGKKGETYNVGSGKAIEIQYILDTIISLSTKEIIVEVDEDKLRPVDVSIIEADISKLQKDTGWNPNIDIKETIKETLDYYRNK